jgi:hypothetical protein
MQPETFEHHAAVHDYADRHGLAYLWEGTAAFENRRRTLAPEQYQILTVHTPKGMTRVILFSKDILKAEWKTDTPRHDAPADKRARAWAKREARMKRAVEKHRSRDRRG